MNSIAGQAEKIKLYEKFTDFIKKTKEEKLKKTDVKNFISELYSSKSRLETIRKNLELAEDRDTKEYCIYRLKAAELDFSRHLKYAKQNNLILTPTPEDIL